MSDGLTQIPGFRLDSRLHESFRTLVYRGVRLEDGAGVAIKCLRSEYPAARDVARIRGEYEVARAIVSDSVIRPEGFGTLGSRAFLVSAYFDGIPLSRLGAEKLPLPERLSLMVKIVRAVGAIHEAGVVHKDLSPGNILVDPTFRAVRIIDFDIASRLAREQQEAIAPPLLEGSLRYMSPEQTGRMNRTIDYRADFYSLGAVFYEMLAGAPLFDSEDATELVHHHIAKRPFFPLHVRQQIPPGIREIVLKLLAKTPEDRYWSAAGIIHDLEHAQKELVQTGDVESFSLGEHDASDRFVVAQRLYGREEDSAHLLDLFAEAAAGAKRVVLLSGHSGIGKSALVREVHKPLLERRAYFASGKADQLRRNAPYAPLAQALGEVVRQLLSENEEARADWQIRIREGVGPSVRALADIVPELAAVIGPLRPIAVLEPREAHNRLQEAFRALLRVLATAQHPLVLFVDDLQWVDTASLGLLEALLSDATVNHLLFIGSYRSNEVASADPLALMVARLKDEGVSIEEMALGPLTVDDVARLMADSFPFRQAPIEPLARLVHQRAQGVPFFVLEYLQYLHQDGLIHFNRPQGAWIWDLDAIAERGVSEGVAEIVRARLLRTPPATIAALEAGACIGARFDLGTLAKVTGQPAGDLGASMLAAVQAGIVTLVGAAYQLHEDAARQGSVSFRFVHDRVRQAAYELLPSDQRRQIHLRIADVLRGGQAEGAEDNLFDLVDHLNQAWPLLSTPEARREALDLNLRAASRAKRNAAYDVALRCLRFAMPRLPKDGWCSDYALTRDLHLERAECEYLGGDRRVAEEILEQGLAHVLRPLERAPFYSVAIPLRTNQGRPDEAIALGREALALLGVDLPLAPTPEEVEAAIVQTRKNLEGLSRTALIELPRMEDPEKLAILRLLNRLGPPTYFADPHLYAYMHCLVVAVSLAHGHASESVRGYSVYGMILGTHNRRYQEGRRYGELAIELADRLGSMHMKGVSRVLYGCFIGHWTRDAEESLSLLDGAYRYLREAGDVVLASFALCFHAITLLVQGVPLARVRASSDEYLGYLKGVGYRDMSALMLCLRHQVLALEGQTDAPTALDAGEYQEAEAHRDMLGFAIKTPLHYYDVAKIQLHYLFGELEAAETRLASARVLSPLSWGALFVAEQEFYAGLVALAQIGRAPGSPATEQRRQTAAAARANLRDWAQSAPGNFLARHLLLEAEAARIDGAHHLTMEMYDGAIQAARERESLPLEALAAELAGAYFSDRGRQLAAGAYLKHAHYTYQRWGAVAKTAQLERRYPNVLQGPPAGGAELRDDGAAPGSGLGGQAGFQVGLQSLDLAATTKATRALAEEIVLDRLVTKFMQILVENAGAELGCLILPGPKGLRILARAHVNAGVVLVDEALDEGREVIPALVERVARTQEPALYDDARAVHELRHDPEVSDRQPRSVLCLPVVHLGRLSCVVYLENNLASGVFTKHHVEVLRMLSAQAAISIENANLYAGLQEKVAQLEQAQRQAAERERPAAAASPAGPIAPGYDLVARSAAAEGATCGVLEVPGGYWIWRLGPDGRVSFSGVAGICLVWREAGATCERFAPNQGFRLLPGDLLVLIGATPAEQKRLLLEIERLRGQPVEAIRDQLARTVALLTPNAQNEATVLVARYAGPSPTLN